MKFSTRPVKRSVKSKSDITDLLAVQESLHTELMNLDASIRQVDEVQQIMDNINFSVEALTKYGNDAIKILNVDGSLENLLGIPEKLITVEKSLEGFSDAARSVWEKIKEMVIGLIQKIKAFFSKSGPLAKFSDTILSETLTDLQHYSEHPDDYTVDFSENLRYSHDKKAILHFRSVYPIKDASKFLIAETTRMYGKSVKYINELADDKKTDSSSDHDYTRYNEIIDDIKTLSKNLQNRCLGDVDWHIEEDESKDRITITVYDTNSRGAGPALADKQDVDTLKGLGCRGAVDAKAIIDTINELADRRNVVEKQLDAVESLFRNMKKTSIRTDDDKDIKESAAIAKFVMQLLRAETKTYRNWLVDLVDLGKEFQWHLVRKGKVDHYDNTNTNHNG